MAFSSRGGAMAQGAATKGYTKSDMLAASASTSHSTAVSTRSVVHGCASNDKFTMSTRPKYVDVAAEHSSPSPFGPAQRLPPVFHRLFSRDVGSEGLERRYEGVEVRNKVHVCEYYEDANGSITKAGAARQTSHPGANKRNSNQSGDMEGAGEGALRGSATAGISGEGALRGSAATGFHVPEDNNLDANVEGSPSGSTAADDLAQKDFLPDAKEAERQNSVQFQHAEGVRRETLAISSRSQDHSSDSEDMDTDIGHTTGSA